MKIFQLYKIARFASGVGTSSFIVYVLKGRRNAEDNKQPLPATWMSSLSLEEAPLSRLPYQVHFLCCFHSFFAAASPGRPWLWSQTLSARSQVRMRRYSTAASLHPPGQIPLILCRLTINQSFHNDSLRQFGKSEFVCLFTYQALTNGRKWACR